MKETLSDSQEGGNDVVEKVVAIEAELGRYAMAWLQGTWTPAHDERLVRLFIPDWVFPLESVPPESEFRLNCEAYQKGREPIVEFKDVPAPGASATTKLAYYEKIILNLARRQGNDLCWEIDGLLQLLPVKSIETVRTNTSFLARCSFCLHYRSALGLALQGK